MHHNPSSSIAAVVLSRQSPSGAAPLTRRAPAFSRTLGFSLLEVVLAITLAGMLMALVIARIDLNRMQANSTVQMLDPDDTRAILGILR